MNQETFALDQTTILIIVAAVVLVALVLLFLVRGRKQHVQFGSDTTAPAPRAAAPAPAAAPEEGHGVGSEMSAAIEDVIDQFVGIDAHPSGQPATSAGAGDTLTTLKGLGPKAAARLGELGVTRFTQMAAWNEADVAAIDAQMGAFKGRITRDQWVEQARLLAAGERDQFETRYGKLGG